MMRFAAKRRRLPAEWARVPKWAWGTGRGERGAQLFEFALVLPMLCVLAVGVIDFAQGFILKQKLTNAAREGARIAVQYNWIDTSQPLPDSIETIGNAVKEYLANAAIDISSIDADPTKTGPGEWTYYDGNGDALIVIDRLVPIPVTVGVVTTNSLGTRVTVSYPYSWSFSQVIGLLSPSASYSSSFLISSDVVMRQLTN